jgi:glyoxylase-like metal-dependent hydrolase (beta-lactamase superfamily II)
MVAQKKMNQTGRLEYAASSGFDPPTQTLARRQWHTKRLRMWLGLLVMVLSAASVHAAGFTQPDAAALPNVYQWTDTVNVWVVRDGESAVIIDLGDGSVLEHLKEIGVTKVEWVLFTNHHREHVQGSAKLAAAARAQGSTIQVGVPAGERNLFEKPTDYRKMKVRLQDAYTIHGASYVRPPVAPIKVDRAFEKMDTFKWHGHEFWCVDTKGSSPGAMSYLVKFGERWTAFSGDVMLEGSKLNNWFDSEWDYGFAAGIWALSNSAAQVAGYDPLWLLPAHGPAIREPQAQLTEFRKRLHKFEKPYLRGYGVSTFAGSSQDPLSRPTKVPHVWQVSKHVYKFRGPDYYPNFYLIIADSGRALSIDCGLIKPEVLDRAIVGMREHLNLKAIDAMIPTHMHGDHFLQGPHLREKYGTQLWALDKMADVCEHPEWFDYAAPIQAYGQKIDERPIDGVKFDRLFKDGETLKWEGYEFTIDWMPGQTEFALGVQGVVDGKRIVFTGDNIFGDPTDPVQTGHEAVVCHNSSIFEEGYILGSEYLSRSKPDLLLGGHSYVMPEPKDFIERYRKWSYAMRDSFKELIREEQYEYGYDPFWVRAQPYRSTVAAGGEPIELTVHVRNFLKRAEPRRIELHASPGLTVEPKVWEGTLEPESRGTFKIKVSAAADAQPGVKLVAFDITRDGRRYGELFDAIVEVKPAGK